LLERALLGRPAHDRAADRRGDHHDHLGRRLLLLYGIRVNCVAPGNVGGGVWDKPDVPFGEDVVNSLAPPRPLDIANGVLFLSSSLSPG